MTPERLAEIEHYKVFAGDLEFMARCFHEVYQKEAKRQGDVRHHDDYAVLPEPIKEFDRALARFVKPILDTLQTALREAQEVPDWDTEDNPYFRRWREMTKLANQSIDERDALQRRVEALLTELHHALESRPGIHFDKDCPVCKEAALRGEVERFEQVEQWHKGFCTPSCTSGHHTSGCYERMINDAKATLAQCRIQLNKAEAVVRAAEDWKNGKDGGVGLWKALDAVRERA